MVSLGRPYHFKIFKSWLPQILLGPFLNTLTQMWSLNVPPNSNIGPQFLLLFDRFYIPLPKLMGLISEETLFKTCPIIHRAKKKSLKIPST